MKSKKQKELTHSWITPSILLITFMLLIGFYAIWPNTVPTQKTIPVKVARPVKAKNSRLTKAQEFELIAPQKKDSVAKKGLGASLAESPLPKPASKLSLPKDLSLGEHLIQLKGGEWRLRIMITLSSENKDFVRFASPLKRRLIQMLFFLVHHRASEALRLPSAEERLKSDLFTRFSNVLKKQDFELYIDSFSLEEVEYIPE